MSRIFKKEFSQFFKSPAGYIYLAIFLAITGYYFTVNNLLAQTNDIKEYFNTMIFTLMFLIPILTMRLLSEERKLKTDQLLYTLPIRVRDIVFGKFLSAYAVFAIGVAVTMLFLPVIAVFGNVDWVTAAGCYFGILLAGAAFIALGLFLSSVTENQIVAAIITYAVLLALYAISLLSNYVTGGFWAEMLDWIAIFTRFQNFSIGIFDPSTVVYYISLTVLFVFLTVNTTSVKKRQ